MAGSNDLDLFIRDALKAGQSRQAITDALLQAGWSREELSGALDDYADVAFPVPVPKPRASLSAREAFLYLVLFTLLYFLCFHLGNLLFDLVNAAIPDSSHYSYRNWDFASATRFSTASILISFPLFVWMAHFLGKETERAPIKRYSPVRRWLTYLTLFISATVLIGNLTGLVYNLLGGELTLRFVLKVLIVGMIAGAVFIYYLRDLRRTEVQLRAHHAFGKYLLGTAAAFAILALIGGFMLTGSPAHQRDLRLDERRVQNLASLSSYIELYANNHIRLPESLDEISSEPGFNLDIKDPQTDKPYEYQRLDSLRYQLCAEFATDTSQYRSRQDVQSQWSHGIGRTCFERKLDKDPTASDNG